MGFRPTAIERAFQIAQSGTAGSVADIRKKLKDEGYDPHAFQGKTVSAQLSAIIKKVRGGEPPEHSSAKPS